MFWIETYRPRTLDGIVHHTRIRDLLAQFAVKQNFPHLLFAGPHGTGKSAAMEAMLCMMFGVSSISEALDVTIIQTADLIEGRKAYFEGDERFIHIFKKEASFLTNLKHIINWYAGMKPIDAAFRVIVFEDAHTLPHDIQHALRRIMEQYSQTCRFIFCTINSSILIPPILSRCFPLYFEPIPEECIVSELLRILQLEKEEFDGEEFSSIPDEDLFFLAKSVHGDLRKAIMHAEVMVTTAGTVNSSDLDRDEISLLCQSMFQAVMEHDRALAQERLLTLMAEHGLSAREVLRELMHVIRSTYHHPDIVRRIAETDFLLIDAANEYVQMNALLTDLAYCSFEAF
ncbi:MAG: replication protein C [Methanomicrobiales archaeon]|jgi:replication factor C small subunit|nr:replication protein C [Methanomicrobiales archaeon]